MRPLIAMSVAALAVGCPQPDPNFSDSYDDVVRDFGSLQQTVETLQGQVGELSTQLDASNARVQDLETLLAETSAEQLAYVGELQTVVDVSTDANTVIFSGRDVRITTGAEAGRGNLYIGEVVPGASSGAHNLVMGSGHSWTTTGSLIMGVDNQVTGDSAFVSGEDHTASADFVGLLAGKNNTASGPYSATVSGDANDVDGDYSVTIAGSGNDANGDYSVVVTGGNNEAEGRGGVIVSGSSNTIDDHAFDAVIISGKDHVIEGSTADGEAERNVLIGGSDNLMEAASTESVVVGGTNNTSNGRDLCVAVASVDPPPGAPDGTRGPCRSDGEITFTPSSGPE